jgi:hypothetical protein
MQSLRFRITTMRRMIPVGMVLVAFAAGPLAAQRPAAGATATVSGVVYDSIGRRPVAGATVEFVSGDDPGARPFTAVSDASGRYALSGLRFGSYLAGFFHPALDTLGLESAPRRVELNSPSERINLATPSARTVSATICPAGAASDSTGVLIGHVRSTDGEGPIGGASVLVEWSEVIIDAQGVRDRNRQVTGRSAEPGWFAICGLPTDATLQARAFASPDSSGFVEVDVPPNGLRHVTFFLGGASLVTLSQADTTPGDTTRATMRESVWRGRARLSGTVTDQRGQPVANAHAVVWGTGLDAPTNERGAFVLEGLPGGTQTLEIRVIGYAPVTRTVHLAESRPATADIVLGKKVEVLSTVTVRGEMLYSRNLAEFNRRRRIGFGQFRTSEEIARRGRNAKLSQLLQEFMGVTVESRSGGSLVTMQRNSTTASNLASLRGSCIPTLYVNGVIDYVGDFDFYYSDEIAGLEVYREHNRPWEYLDPSNPCGAVAIWTRVPPKKPKSPKRP